MKSLFRVVFSACMVGMAIMPSAWAQDYPNRPIKIVVPNTPGTLPDVVARLMGPELTKLLGQPVVVENRPGASQIIGYEYAAKAPADGYTLVSTISAELALLPLMNKGLRFDAWKDLPPIAGVAEATLIMASASSKPWKNVKELVAYGKANPGKLNYALSSPAITLPMLAFLQGYGIEAVAISYKGGVPAVQSVMAGETDVGFMPESYAITAADRARALAVTSPQRLPAFPDAPTFAELGDLKIPGNSYSLNAPAGTPPAVIAKLQSAIATVLKQPQLRTQLERSHLRVVNETQEVAAQGLADRIKIYGDIVKRAGITPQ